MKITLNFCQFIDNWPESRKEQFSYEGKNALFEYLEGYEESTGEELEFDPVAICCDYTEYKNLKEVLENYDNIKNLEDLEDNTQVIKIEGKEGLIIQQF